MPTREESALRRTDRAREKTRRELFPDAEGLTLLDTWHFLGALAKLETPQGKLFDVADLRRHRDLVFAAMDPDDQYEAMLVMPNATETLSSLRARLARDDKARIAKRAEQAERAAVNGSALDEELEHGGFA